MNIDDILGECAKVFLYCFVRNRGEKKDFHGALCCSGEAPERHRDHVAHEKSRCARRPRRVRRLVGKK